MSNKNPPIEFTRQSQARFYGMIGRVQSVMGKDLQPAIKMVAGYFVTSAAAATPKAKAKRKVIRNPNAETDGGAARWAVVKHTQKQRGIIVPIGESNSLNSEVTNDPRREIKRRGLAKACWLAAAVKAKVKGNGRVDGEVAGDANRGSEGSFNGSKENPEFIIANQFPGIENLDRGGPMNPPHHIMGTAIARSANRLENRLKAMAAKLGKEWEK